MESCSNNTEKDVALDKNEEQNLLVRLQLAEEMASRQAAQLMMEEKREKKLRLLKQTWKER